MHEYTREFAGLAAAFFWALSALAWSLAGRRVGSVAVTSLRIALAAAILAALHWAILGRPWPQGLDGESLGMLVVSGILGAGMGDLCLFRGLLLLGPRLGMLILSLSPIVSAALACFTPMHEGLGLWSVVGIAMTVGGVVWVVVEPGGRDAWRTSDAHFRQGVLVMLAATVLIAAGYVVSRMGMQSGARFFSGGLPRAGVDPLSASLIRMTSAAAFTWLALPILGRVRSTARALTDRKAMLILTGGTIVGPVIGVWLSMVALQGVAAGVAVALLNVSPVMMILIAWLAYGDRPSFRSLLGTAVAVAGVVILMLRPA
jgi:drug/metabolite transporter (DMT)-like permease